MIVAGLVGVEAGFQRESGPALEGQHEAELGDIALEPEASKPQIR